MKVIKIIMPDYLGEFGPQPQITPKYREKLQDYANFLSQLNLDLKARGHGKIDFLLHSINDLASAQPNIKELLEAEEDESLTFGDMRFEDPEVFNRYISAQIQMEKEMQTNLRDSAKNMKVGLFFQMQLDVEKFNETPLVAFERTFNTTDELNQYILDYSTALGININSSDDKQYNSTISTTPEGKKVSDTVIFIILQSSGEAED